MKGKKRSSIVSLLLMTILLYLLSTLAGVYLFNLNNKIYINNKKIYKIIQSEIVTTKFKSINFLSILLNNIRAILLLLLGFGFTTLMEILLNGISLGLLIKYCLMLQERLATPVLLLILPHGIFEIPAMMMAGAAGFKIPCEIIRYLAGKKEQPLTKEDIKEYLTLASISIILIVIAAWVEANVTLKIAKTMLNSTKGI